MGRERKGESVRGTWARRGWGSVGVVLVRFALVVLGGGMRCDATGSHTSERACPSETMPRSLVISQHALKRYPRIGAHSWSHVLAMRVHRAGHALWRGRRSEKHSRSSCIFDMAICVYQIPSIFAKVAVSRRIFGLSSMVGRSFAGMLLQGLGLWRHEVLVGKL